MKTRYIPALILFVVAVVCWVLGCYFRITHQPGGNLIILGFFFGIIAGITLLITALIHKLVINKNTNPLP